MNHKTIRKSALVITLVIIGCLVLYAFPIEADRTQVTFEDTLTVPAGTYEYATTTAYVPPPPESGSYIASFSVPSGQTVKFCTLISPALFELWQQDQYQPIWIEGSTGSLGSSGQSQTGDCIDYYLVVLNEGSTPQDVKVSLAKTWHESNKLSWIISPAIISLGIGLIPILIYGNTRLNQKYSALLFAMTFIMIFFLLPAPYWSTPPNPARDLISAMPGILFFEAFPLIPLLYLLQKNNAFARFQNWNNRQLLKASGTCMLLGYMVPIASLIFGMLTAIGRLPIDPYIANAFALTIGTSTMIAGLLIFIGLWTIQPKTNPTLTATPQHTKM